MRRPFLFRAKGEAHASCSHPLAGFRLPAAARGGDVRAAAESARRLGQCGKRLRFIAVVFVLGAGIPFLVWLMASFVPKNIKQQALELSFNSVGSDSLYPPDKPSSMATDTNATRDMIKAATSPASRGQDS